MSAGGEASCPDSSGAVFGFPVSKGRVTSDVLDRELATLRAASNGLDPDVCVAISFHVLFFLLRFFQISFFFVLFSFCFILDPSSRVGGGDESSPGDFFLLFFGL